MKEQIKSYIYHDNFTYILVLCLIMADFDYPFYTGICYLSSILFVITLRDKESPYIEISALFFMFLASVMGTFIYSNMIFKRIMYMAYAIAVLTSIFNKIKEQLKIK